MQCAQRWSDTFIWLYRWPGRCPEVAAYPELDYMALGHLLSCSSADTLQEIEDLRKEKADDVVGRECGWNVTGALLGSTAEVDTTRW